MRSLKLFAFAVIGLFTFAACDSNDSDDDDPMVGDIVTVATDAGFNTLTAAVAAADLVETLQGDGPFTVFAPTDEAFGKLDPATLNSLLEPENQDQLASILTYHVVAGRFDAAAVTSRSSFETVQGETISISVVDGQARVNNANIISLDVPASNGIIHVIDTVILPPSIQQQ